jgi:hypothetical protein
MEFPVSHRGSFRGLIEGLPPRDFVRGHALDPDDGISPEAARAPLRALRRRRDQMADVVPARCLAAHFGFVSARATEVHGPPYVSGR